MQNLTLISMLIMIVLCVFFFVLFELSKPKPEMLLPLVIICAAGIVGRLIFIFIPQVQPVTVLVIITGYYFGLRYGFVCGAMVALISNMSMSQGPWTPFQMVAWGVVGLIAALLPHLQKKYINLLILLVYAFVSAFIFSFISDIITISYFGDSITLASAITVWGSGALFNIPHAIGNIFFMLAFYPFLSRKLERINAKYNYSS